MAANSPVNFSNRSGTRGVKADYVDADYATLDYAKLGPSASPVELHYAEVAITAAQMLLCRATPVVLVAAPGAGKVILLESLLLIKDGANGYTETSDNLQVKYTDGSGAAASDAIESGGFLDATADDMIAGRRANDCAPVANAALVLHNTGDGELDGTGDPIRAKIFYSIHETGL